MYREPRLLAGAVPADIMADSASCYQDLPCRIESCRGSTHDKTLAELCRSALDTILKFDHPMFDECASAPHARGAPMGCPCCRDDALLAALGVAGVPLPALPAPARQLLLQHLPCTPNVLTPSHLRAHIQQTARKAPARLAQLAPGQAASLLLYCLSDLEDRDPELPAQVAGLPLLPTRDGGLADFGPATADGAVVNHGSGGGGDGARLVFLAADADELLLASAPQLLVDRGAAGPDLSGRQAACALVRCLRALQQLGQG